MTQIKVKNLSKIYGTGDSQVEAVKDVSFAIAPGSFVAITGESGSGKSTLLTILGGMSRPTAGRVLYEDQDLYGMSERDGAQFRNQNLGFVFQNFHLVPYLTLEENVMLPLAIRSQKSSEKRKKAREALERVGLGGKFKRLPSEVSGGEQERAAIARAIVHSPPLLLADEPTGNLDSKNGRAVMDFFTELNRDGMSIVMVTHSHEWSACAEGRIFITDGVVTGMEGKSLSTVA